MCSWAKTKQTIQTVNRNKSNLKEVKWDLIATLSAFQMPSFPGRLSIQQCNPIPFSLLSQLFSFFFLLLFFSSLICFRSSVYTVAWFNDWLDLTHSENRARNDKIGGFVQRKQTPKSCIYEKLVKTRNSCCLLRSSLLGSSSPFPHCHGRTVRGFCLFEKEKIYQPGLKSLHNEFYRLLPSCLIQIAWNPDP